MKNIRRGEDLKIVKQNLTKKTNELISIKNEIECKQKSLKKLTSEANDLKLALLEHYHNLLKEGKDTR